MKKLTISRKKSCNIRHQRFLNKLKQNHNSKPRLVVTKSNAHIVAQIFDDMKGITICSSSSIQLKLKSGNKQACAKVGEDIAKKALAKQISEVAFDRGGNKYHGRVAALADAARKAGLKF